MLSGVTQHWYHWKHVDVKHLFNFKWKLKVHTFVMQSQNQSMHVWLLNMWLLRIIKLDLFSCAIPELQCLCHNSTAWILEWEKKFSLCLEERRKDSCLLYTWAIWHVILPSDIQYCSDLQNHKRQKTQMILPVSLLSKARDACSWDLFGFTIKDGCHRVMGHPGTGTVKWRL